MKLTYELAHAASMDAGNDSMRKAGRKQWNKADQSAALRQFAQLWPIKVIEQSEDGLMVSMSF